MLDAKAHKALRNLTPVPVRNAKFVAPVCSCGCPHCHPGSQKTDKSDNIFPIYMWSGNSLFWILGVSYSVSHSGEGISRLCVTRAKSVSFVR